MFCVWRIIISTRDHSAKISYPEIWKAISAILQKKISLSTHRLVRRSKALYAKGSFLGKITHSAPAALVFLAVFVLTTSFSTANQGGLAADYMVDLTPVETAQIATVVAPTTDFVVEDPVEIALSLSENFLTAQPVAKTVKSEPEPQATPQSASQERKGATEYTVQPRDTLSSIGLNFGLKLITLKTANSLANVDSLKPGQVLKIPPADLSSEMIAQLQKQTQQAQARKRGAGGRSWAKVKGVSGLIFPLAWTKGVTRRLTRYHTGVDYRCQSGVTVYAAAPGTVIEADGYGWNSGWGKTLVTSHGGGVTLRYAHLSQIFVSGGQVSQGQPIGACGSTGRSTGTHLHFEERVNGVPVDPGI